MQRNQDAPMLRQDGTPMWPSRWGVGGGGEQRQADNHATQQPSRSNLGDRVMAHAPCLHLQPPQICAHQLSSPWTIQSPLQQHQGVLKLPPLLLLVAVLPSSAVSHTSQCRILNWKHFDSATSTIMRAQGLDVRDTTNGATIEIFNKKNLAYFF
jgi:hypothetical protein